MAIHNSSLFPNSNAEASGDCLASIPDSAWVDWKVNCTFSGFYENYENKTVAYYPFGSCPEPVPQSLYGLVLKVEANSSFTRMDNGQRWLYDPVYSGCCGNATSHGVVVAEKVILQFDDWSSISIKDINESFPTACWPWPRVTIVNVPVNITIGSYVPANITFGSSSSNLRAGPACTPASA